MPNPIKTNLIDIYDAWQIHDYEWLASYLPHDFSHLMNIPPEQLELGGLRRGKCASLDRLKEIYQEYETRHVDVTDFAVGGDKVVADVTTSCTPRQGGPSLLTTKRHIWHVEDGWPVRLEEFYDLSQVGVFLKSL